MARPKPFFIIGGYFKVLKLPSNSVGNSVKEHLTFAVNKVIATGSLSLKQIRKSSTVLILLPPFTAQHLSVTPTTSVPSASSARFSAQCSVIQSPDKIKNDDTKILIGFRAGFSASRQFSVGREKN